MRLPPADKFELNRMAHARAQELWLPGSPPGKSGHRNLHIAAMLHYGKSSWSELSMDQMKRVYDFLDSNRRMPMKGEI